jgi:hypothetical protein
MNTFTPSELEALEKLNLGSTSSPLSSPKRPNASFREASEQQKVDIQKLEKKAEEVAAAEIGAAPVVRGGGSGKENVLTNGTS